MKDAIDLYIVTNKLFNGFIIDLTFTVHASRILNDGFLFLVTVFTVSIQGGQCGFAETPLKPPKVFSRCHKIWGMP